MEILIAGAGPAGLAAAVTLLDERFAGKIHLIELGRPLTRRGCPVDHGRKCRGCGGICNVGSGIGGCIHFGDAVKLSRLPAGKRLWDTLGPEAADLRLAEAVCLVESSLGRELSFCEPPDLPQETDFLFRPYPVGNLASREVRTLLEQLDARLRQAPNVALHTETRVERLESTSTGGYHATLQSRHGCSSVFVDQVIVAVGRAGLFWWRRTLRELGLAFRLPQPSVGLRFEMNHRWLLPAGRFHPDYKVTMHDPAGKFKSFCFCGGSGGGHIKCIDFGPFTLLDGHVSVADDEPVAPDTPGNFAMLHQLGDLSAEDDPMPVIQAQYLEPYRRLRPDAPGHPVAQRFDDFREHRGGLRTWPELRASLDHRPSIQDIAPARVDTLFPLAVHEGFCQAVERYLGAVLGHHNGDRPNDNSRFALDRILVVALVLEGLWDVMETDLHLETSRPGLFVAGDCVGVAQGILQAMATGIAAARRIASRSDGEPGQSARDRLIYDRYWTDGDHWEPSETFTVLLKTLQECFGDRVRIADLACGIGRHAVFAAERGASVVAIDHSSRAIHRLQERAALMESEAIEAIEAIEGDFVSWLERGPAGDLDGVVCFDALHHVSPSKEVVRAVLAAIQRRIRPGGLALVTLLSNIDYGSGGAPVGRLLLSASEAEELLDEAFSKAELIRSKRTDVRFDRTVNLDTTTGCVVSTHYQAVRVLRLYRIGGIAP